MSTSTQSSLPESKFLDRTTVPHIATLILLAGVAALSINLFLPSMPALARHFGVEYSVIQFAVSAYLALTAVLQLFIGPIADRFGRRPVVIAGLLVFVIASVGCVFAPNATIFMICRFAQAIVAVAMVMSRAIVRDIVPAEEAASMIGYVSMFMALLPMLGPVAGGFLEQAFGWQSNFVVLAVFGGIVLAVTYFDLMETNPKKTGGFREQFALYPDLFKSRRFWGYTAISAFAAGCFFAFLGGAPYVASKVLNLSPGGTGIVFGIISAGYVCGNYVSGRYAKTVGLFRMMLVGTVLTALGMCLSTLLVLLGFINAVAIFGPVFFVGLGNGLTIPSANAGMLSVRPELAGTAAGLGGALMIAGGAGLSGATGLLLGDGQSPLPLILMMLLSAVLSVLATLYTLRVERQVAAV